LALSLASCDLLSEIFDLLLEAAYAPFNDALSLLRTRRARKKTFIIMSIGILPVGLKLLLVLGQLALEALRICIGSTLRKRALARRRLSFGCPASVGNGRPRPRSLESRQNSRRFPSLSLIATSK
jgi:hypothetical protein